MRYTGSELELFRNAINWKRYYARCLSRFVSGDVLEVGAGLGGTTPALSNANVRTWLCLEPDAKMLGPLKQAINALGKAYEASTGTIDDLGQRQFDSILYIDVLEHIQDDALELKKAAARLRAGGHLVVLSPAHQWLFTEFDRALGHYRRYSRKELAALGPNELSLKEAFYLDSVGVVASLANRVLLKQALPTETQIQFWDKTLVPLSRVLDPCFARKLGKSVVAVWTKPRA